MSNKRKLILIGSALFAARIATLVLAAVVVQSRVPIRLPPSFSVSTVFDDYVHATGTWVIEREKQAFRLQVTDTQCERQLVRCTEATASE
jgi:hypothetical protein